MRARDGIDLDVAAGEFFLILGPSAADEAATLRSIAGLERPGRRRHHVRQPRRGPCARAGRDMSMIFQTFALCGIGARLVVPGGLAFNLIPHARPGVWLRWLIAVALIVPVILAAAFLLAVGTSYLYAWHIEANR